MQRRTRFQYWRCDNGHGRLITFMDFLREKDFVRPLTPQQLEELRQNIQTINCSNCGAAIDLVEDSVCAHCGAAVSMLDLQQMARTVGQLQASASGPQAAGRGKDRSMVENRQHQLFQGLRGQPQMRFTTLLLVILGASAAAPSLAQSPNTAALATQSAKSAERSKPPPP